MIQRIIEIAATQGMFVSTAMAEYTLSCYKTNNNGEELDEALSEKEIWEEIRNYLE